MSRVHNLKIKQQPFDELVSGVKTGEVRDCSDRDFQVGDMVELFLVDETGGNALQSIARRITHVQRGYGLPDNICVLSYAQPAVPVTTQEPIMLTAVAELIDDGDGGLEPSWLLEGGTAELFAGMTLLVAENAPELCQEDGSAEVFTRADTGEVEQLQCELDAYKASRERLHGWIREEQLKNVHLNAQLAERDALLHEVSISPEWSLSVDLQVRISDTLSASAEPSAPVERDPCPGCGVPGFTATCNRCVPY
ncbi:DUF3850 domain-containing protein [Pseudomonas sp. JDS28PS106]|uniref:DUF3850 domain-containing protein n=1 Tax=Pseudomonas sp. JDS28PS106 TaxID=2497235 RepID=UPI002FCF1B64